MSTYSPPTLLAHRVEGATNPPRRAALRLRGEARASGYPHRTSIESGAGFTIPGTWSVDRTLRPRMGVEAVTEGTHTVFAESTPPLRVAAHEAVHQAQHRGTTRDQFLGPEVHAEAVAARLDSHARAADLVGPRGDRVPPRRRAYVQLDPKQLGGADIRAAADKWPLKIAETGDAVTSVFHDKTLFASKDAVTHANRTLESQGAGLSIHMLSQRLRPQVVGGVKLKPLFRVDMRFKVHGGGDSQEFYEDCGVAAYKGMGIERPGAITRGPEGTSHTPFFEDPLAYRTKILFNAGLGRTPEEALAEYEALGPESAREFDKRHGLNQYAAPRLGEAFVMAPKAPSPDEAQEKAKKQWGYHWAMTILKLGGDRVTFEAAATSTKVPWDHMNDKWKFDMYGSPRTGKATKTGMATTFHDDWTSTFEATGTMTMVAGHIPEKQDLASLVERIEAGQFAAIPTVEVEMLSAQEREEIVALVLHQVSDLAGTPQSEAAIAFLERISAE